MIVNGSTPQHMYLLPAAATKAVARAFTPFFLLPELLQIRLADRLTFPARRQQDICPARLMSITLTNLQICLTCFAIVLCIWHLVSWWFVHLLFNSFRSKQPNRTSFANFLVNANQHATRDYKQDFAVCRSKISQIWTTAAGTTLKKLPLILQSFFVLQRLGWAVFWRIPCILIFTKKLSVACHIKGEDSS